MAASTKSRVTTSHEEIRRWVAARGGRPVVIVRPQSADEKASLICIYFPEDRSEGPLNEISWAKWFKQFDAAGLALLYQEDTANGEKSNFNKLVSRKTVDQVESAVGGKGRSASRKRSRRDGEVGATAPSHSAGPPRGGKGGSRKVSKKFATKAGIVPAPRKRN